VSLAEIGAAMLPRVGGWVAAARESPEPTGSATKDAFFHGLNEVIRDHLVKNKIWDYKELESYSWMVGLPKILQENGLDQGNEITSMEQVEAVTSDQGNEITSMEQVEVEAVTSAFRPLMYLKYEGRDKETPGYSASGRPWPSRTGQIDKFIDGVK